MIPRGSSTDELTEEFKTSVIDVFLANSIFDPGVPGISDPGFLSGVAIYPGMGRGTPGVVVAAKLGGAPTEPRRTVDSMARTMAHELGHYLMKLGDNAHEGQPDWNLMVAGGPGTQRNLKKEQSDRLRNGGVTPAAPDQ